MLHIFRRKQRTPQDVADQAERILSGHCRKWDVDVYENMNLKDPKLKELHARTGKFGLPETWVRLDDAEKNELRAIIEEMRKLESTEPLRE
jgi:hypothetical protein